MPVTPASVFTEADTSHLQDSRESCPLRYGMQFVRGLVSPQPAVLAAFRAARGCFLPPSTLPTPEALSALVSACDGVDAAAVGVSPAHVRSLTGRSSYIEVFDDAAHLTVGIFMLGPGMVMPLHNHPNMTVVSRV